MLRLGTEPITARLILAIGSRSGLEAPLQLGYYMIGRSKECQIRPKSRSVSREHCLIHNCERGLRIVDLGSSAGTFVNGKRLRPRVWEQLPNGAQLRCGKVLFQVSIDQQHSLSAVEKAEIKAAERAGSTDSMLAGQAWQDVDIAGFLDSEDEAEREHRYGSIRARNAGEVGHNAAVDPDVAVNETTESDTDIDLDLFEEEFDDGAVAIPAQDNRGKACESAERSADDGSQSRRPVKKRKPGKPLRTTPTHKKVKNPKAARAHGSWSLAGNTDGLKLIGAVLMALAVIGFCGYSAYQIFAGPEVRVIKNID